MIAENSSILVVDDDADICENMSDILTDMGYRVDVAHEGKMALTLVQGHRYDLALLDLKMPGMDGLTLYREIKQVQAGLAAVLVTAFAGGSTAEEALAAGASHVLPKPVDLPRLLHLIDEALEMPLVLVVDDDIGLCANLWDVLHDRGYRICIAHDGRQAVARVRDATRVVLIDLRLPDQDGADLFRQLRQVNPDVRTVLITGCRADEEPSIQQLRVEGIDAICYKPFDMPALLDTIGQLAKPQRGERLLDSSGSN